ncbi:hypothetical protein N0V82_010445 [Gnomoniopsis sp. IMI 355080]|nr:hypothetical protein N0V82_010445 [Gnomoniopsis sp. IMI 355080]
MKVHVKYGPEPGFDAILKLYDRRFGTTLRDGLQRDRLTHTAAKESLFQDSVRSGAISRVLRQIEDDDRVQVFRTTGSADVDGTAAGYVKYEANRWRKCEELFAQEAKAYTRLSNLQGKVIPQMYAHVRLAAPQEAAVTVPVDLLERHETAQYFQVKGILIQRIFGCDLYDLPVSKIAPPDPKEWQGIVQAAIDGAHSVNCQGVCMEDCSPWNVVVEETSRRPFLVDLAQCQFRDEMFAELEDSSSEDEEGEDQDAKNQQAGDKYSGTGSDESDWDPDVAYWEAVRNSNGTAALGQGMARRLRDTKGIGIVPEYPDYKGIIAGIKSEKKELAP